MLLRALETILVIGCYIFLGIINLLRLITNFLANIFKFILMVATLLLAADFVQGLAQPWQSIAWKIMIMGGAVLFVCYIGLAWWRPARFSEIGQKVNKS